MTRRTLYLAVMVAAAALACVAAVVTLLAVSKEAESTFSGKNGKIAFTSTRDTKAESGDIYTMNPNGTDLERLTNHPDEDFEPAWSPDGNKIAFMSFRPDNAESTYSTYSLYTMNARGTRVKPLIGDPRDDHDPAWSPDGSKIAFASYRQDNEDIYTMNADGTDLERLTSSPKEDDAPAWSPDGNRIAFASDRAGNPEIYTVNPNGTRVERLTNSPKADGQPSWSPDGNKIAFTSTRDTKTESGDIYTMTADGTRVRRLTNHPDGDLEPAWSPDGNKIAFTSDRHDEKPCRLLFSCNEIYTMSADGQALERLTDNHAGDFSPDWQPLPPPR